MALVQTTHICQSFYMLLQMWVVCLDAPKLKAVILRPHSKEWGFNFGHNKLEGGLEKDELLKQII